ncbi:MAG TPA: BBP7 family outer membrane beta-barrel protein, partial [Gemmataceae bacterium]|nr:BBP7 family outer membrane beta-barrel protein [Gemmataceae bacterium]
MSRVYLSTLAAWLVGASLAFSQYPANGRNMPADQSPPSPYPQYARNRVQPDEDDEPEIPPPPPLKRTKKQKPPEVLPPLLPASVDDDDPPPPPPPRNPGNKRVQRVQRQVIPADDAETLPPPVVNPNGPVPNGNMVPNGGFPARQFMQGNGPAMPGYGPNFDPNAAAGVGSCGLDCNSCGQCGSCRCPCGPCGPYGRFWLSTEFLMWWVQGQVPPPLVTTQPFIGGAPSTANSAVIGQAGTTVIYGGGPLDQTLWYGLRSRAGFWIDECYMLGVEGSFLYLPHHETFTAECGPGQVVSRPFFDTSTGTQNAELVCFPGVLCGSVTVTSDSQIYGADANLRRNLACCSNCNGGYR